MDQNGVFYTLLPNGTNLFLKPIGPYRPAVKYKYCYAQVLSDDRCQGTAELEIPVNFTQALTLKDDYAVCLKRAETGWLLVKLTEDECHFEEAGRNGP